MHLVWYAMVYGIGEYDRFRYEPVPMPYAKIEQMNAYLSHMPHSQYIRLHNCASGVTPVKRTTQSAVYPVRSVVISQLAVSFLVSLPLFLCYISISSRFKVVRLSGKRTSSGSLDKRTNTFKIFRVKSWWAGLSTGKLYRLTSCVHKNRDNIFICQQISAKDWYSMNIKQHHAFSLKQFSRECGDARYP